MTLNDLKIGDYVFWKFKNSDDIERLAKVSIIYKDTYSGTVIEMSSTKNVTFQMRDHQAWRLATDSEVMQYFLEK